jgi:hypothetical protein
VEHNIFVKEKHTVLESTANLFMKEKHTVLESTAKGNT